MANTAKPITAFAACSAPSLTDVILGVSNVSGNAVTVQITIDDLMSNSAANVISGRIITLSETTTPANSTDLSAGIVQNSLWSDGDYVYYYDGTAIKRAALTSF